MNNANKVLSVLSLFTMSASICMVKPTGLPLPDPTGFRNVPVRPSSLLGLTIEELFSQIDGYIKNAAMQQDAAPVVAASSLFKDYIHVDYFDDCLRKRFVTEYGIKQFKLEGRWVRLYDGRLINAREMHLATPVFKEQLIRYTPLNKMDAHAFIALLIGVEHAKNMNAAYPLP